MRILIGYASKTGTTKTCVDMLCKELKTQDVTLADLDTQRPNPCEYDVVILGSSVRFGKARQSLCSYLQEHGAELCKMPHALFLCCGFGHEFERYVQKIFDRSLLDTSYATLNFGGYLKLEKAGLLEKTFLRWVRSEIRESEISDGEYTPTLPSILPENISMMASYTKRELVGIKEKQV